MSNEIVTHNPNPNNIPYAPATNFGFHEIDAELVCDGYQLQNGLLSMYGIHQRKIYRVHDNLKPIPCIHITNYEGYDSDFYPKISGRTITDFYVIGFEYMDCKTVTVGGISINSFKHKPTDDLRTMWYNIDAKLAEERVLESIDEYNSRNIDINNKEFTDEKVKAYYEAILKYETREAREGLRYKLDQEYKTNEKSLKRAEDKLQDAIDTHNKRWISLIKKFVPTVETVAEIATLKESLVDYLKAPLAEFDAVENRTLSAHNRGKILKNFEHLLSNYNLGDLDTTAFYKYFGDNDVQ